MEGLLEKFEKLKEAEKWVEAAEVEMVLNDEYPNADFDSVSSMVKYTEEEKKELEKRGEKDRKVAHWIGYLKSCGDGGYYQDNTGAFLWYLKAAAAGHLDALFRKGYSLCYGEGVKVDREAALKYFEKAGMAGHGFSCYFSGLLHKNAMHFFQAAIWYQRGSNIGDKESINELERLKFKYPTKICPWGVWRPDREYHSLVPPKVQEAVKTTLLLFKRLGITRYIAYQVCEYIVTRSGWE